MPVPDIRHVVVLMLENRSFDYMLGQLYPASDTFDGLTGSERNTWHNGADETSFPVWTDQALGPAAVTVPDPDPGEAFTDIHEQIWGKGGVGGPMSGFVDNYMGQPGVQTPRRPDAVMHYFTEPQVPVISQLARAFGVSDKWFASGPCQTWPNRLFAHTGSAGGDVNNTPLHVPYLMPTTFERVAAGGKSWGIYFHDFPQSATLGRLWSHPGGFHRFDSFLLDAAAGNLPSYSFIEPRYYPDVAGNKMPNDEHPPHNVADGEELIATVYNALRAGPGWRNTLLIITYDEHGGCYDHVMPGKAASPAGPTPDGFAFDAFGVRVPAVIVSPYVKAGSVIRPPSDSPPFDHTSIFKTLQELFGLDPAPLTARTAAAPSLVAALSLSPENDGPANVASAAPQADPAGVSRLAASPPNGMQQSMSRAAATLPTLGADPALQIRRLAAAPQTMQAHPTAGAAAGAAAAHVMAFLGR
jgi:phospholipase C